MPEMGEVLSWGVVTIGAVIVLYLIWGAIKASLRLMFYVLLLILFAAFLKRYDLLPSQVSLWLEPQRLVHYVQEKFHQTEDQYPLSKQYVEQESSEENEFY